MEERVKEAFIKVKQDIYFLGEELENLKARIQEFQIDSTTNNQILLDIQTELRLNRQKQEELQKEIGEVLKTLEIIQNQTQSAKKTTEITTNPTDPTHPTDNISFKALKTTYNEISTGNEGVPTDRQTDQQTDRQTLQHTETPKNVQNKEENDFFKIHQIIANLDDMKKELRRKFKNLTEMEMNVFSLVYSFEEKGVLPDYKRLSTELNLSESSVRDYIRKITQKGIPINKEKLKNKQIILSISQDLKKVASLNTILELRGL